ncbi:hypothetical protein [Actinomadura montaniterrae]|uniref:Uncharacterized protein n=1 Tax=Actinomadura montaniterrae TaxID=1803903 RepID=A0A6L3VVK9_9ACTN|nr:hypothetical protein [Actinomadura montaniterrae]KAB2382717.1 hypothetical protein F9B16_14065 [Actinomadura montaniterrae]
MARLVDWSVLKTDGAFQRLGLVGAAPGSAPGSLEEAERLCDEEGVVVSVDPARWQAVRVSLWDGPPPVPERDHGVVDGGRPRTSGPLALFRLDGRIARLWPVELGTAPGAYRVRVVEAAGQAFVQVWPDGRQ